MAYRMSRYSTSSAAPRSDSMQQSSSQVSTTTLLNALHTSFSSGQPHALESSTSLVVNTWVTTASTSPDGRTGGTVDPELARRAWEHARRRAEDGCVILGSLHHSTPSLLVPFVSALPLSVPATFYTALNALRPFLHCVTPYNPSLPRHSGLAGVFTFALTGELTGASIGLSTSGIDTCNGLLNVPSEHGHRAFDVFYCLLASIRSEQEREYLNLKPAQRYSLLRKSDTFQAPAYLPTADDAAAADDLRESLKAIGIKGRSFRSLLSVLAALLKLGDAIGFLVDQEELEATCEEVGGLLDLDVDVLLKRCVTEEREILISALYEALVDWVISRANEAIRSELTLGHAAGSSSGSELGPGAHTPSASHNPADDVDSVSVTVIELPSQTLGKAASLRTVFDDTTGINAEMKDDGVPIIPVGASVIREMREAVSRSDAELDVAGTPALREREIENDRRQGVLEKVGPEAEPDSLLHQILYPVSGRGVTTLGSASVPGGGSGSARFVLSNVLGSSRVWFQLALHPTDEPPATLAHQALGHVPWSAGAVSSQIRAWRLPEWANHRARQLDFTADFDVDEFVDRYRPLGCRDGRDGVESWLMERGWSNGEVVVGHERIWIREAAWWEAENMLDMKPVMAEEPVPRGPMLGAAGVEAMQSAYSLQTPGEMVGDGSFYDGSRENLLSAADNRASRLGARSLAPTLAHTMRSTSGGDYGLGHKGDDKRNDVTYYGEVDAELADGKEIIEQKVTTGRRLWVAFVWFMTWWIPSFVLRHVGRMKRPDVRMAWREKVTLIVLIFLFNAAIVFYIVEFGRLLCPNFDKAWNTQEVAYHTTNDAWWVSHHGYVYDLTHFWKLPHSDTNIQTSSQNMGPLAGLDVSAYIEPPLTLACPGIVSDDSITLLPNTSLLYPDAIHTSGKQQTDPTSKLSNPYWYSQRFLPKMSQMVKGQLVYDPKKIKADGENNNHMWFIIDDTVYDLTDYFSTVQYFKNSPQYNFFSSDVTTLIQSNPGQDISKEWHALPQTANNTNTLLCFNQRFKIGFTDFRLTARCEVQNYLLLSFTIIVALVIVIKFLAALQLGGKKRPTQQDKFVICQVPAYTEGEDSLRKGLDSLTALAYDNKRKLICVICDGMIVGGGNDRPTPKIVLDILGVDPKIDPPALPFKSVGQGSEQLNYGKVYSGLYEFEGNVVPYLVVVKVGKESEQTKSKPGNRGKRDSQILLMSFLNRVHHRSPMSPLELEMFHQINNIIGVDPELYEYLFMVDADTKVKEDSLNRLVSACAHDAKIAGICGETSLENEERSWWTMIQVYEYYISHHLSKAFESLFGSVTCLPGCFCMYRLRTADKGRPLIISDKVVEDYADNNVDTLHKKNLLSLGEDRYLTTIMSKNFPTMSFKFLPDAYALTEAPAQFSVLLSQRRRWINSTIHNLSELIWVDMCGFCCFSMRFVVFIDLVGTIILPATFGYLVYLIYRIASHTGPFPEISIIILAAVYGLQAIIFLIKRQWQHIGWMIIYILAYPLWSFVLPVYSFWKQDDFSWGNTRIVIGERGDKQLIAIADEGFDPRSIPLQRWDDYALANNLPGRRGQLQEKDAGLYSDNAGYEMDDMRSVYSSVKPASTILTGFPHAGHQTYMPPPPTSPSPFSQNPHARQSTLSHLSHSGVPRYTDHPSVAGADSHQRLMSMGGISSYTPRNPSQDNLLAGFQSPPPPQHFQQQQGHAQTPSVATAGLSGFTSQGPSNEMIAHAIRDCLAEVDLDSVTKKQLKALTEQRLQCQLAGEKRAFLDRQIDVELANL